MHPADESLHCNRVSLLTEGRHQELVISRDHWRFLFRTVAAALLRPHTVQRYAFPLVLTLCWALLQFDPTSRIFEVGCFDDHDTTACLWTDRWAHPFAMATDAEFSPQHSDGDEDAEFSERPDSKSSPAPSTPGYRRLVAGAVRKLLEVLVFASAALLKAPT